MSEPAPADEPRGVRLWLFRLLAATLVPALFLVVAEGGLRLFGVGYPTDFLVRRDGGGWTTNHRFGWRFFPRRLARTPVPVEIPDPKGDAYRIFVLGGSAARGTPDSAYSFGRMLEVLLEARYPATRFEVVNAAMTAINSHVARVIARDLAGHEPDLFVVYLGNNEVVGPFGAGTVFGDFSPSLTVIRGSVALGGTRLGQLLDGALGGARRDARHAEWRGMEMFLEQRVAADDLRLAKVYEHFHANLSDLVDAAHGQRARTLLVTVATNLRDQPPFASLHRPDLTATEEESWRSLFEAGAAAADRGDHEAALGHWRDAELIDDRHAELHFRAGRSLLATGRVDDARDRLVRARDLDALRFRADSRINDTIRRLAAERTRQGVTLVDAERLFIDGLAGGTPLPGRQLFHEHVHLSFDGNMALASAVFEHLEPLLPQPFREGADGIRLDRTAVAERLAYTPFDRLELEDDILQIVSRPPFDSQPGQAVDLEARRQQLAQLRQLSPETWQEAEDLYRRRLESDGDDLEIRRRFASLLQARGDHGEAAEQWRLLTDRLSEIESWRASLAISLTDAGRPDEAFAELERLRLIEGDTAGLHVNLGTVHESRGDADAAEAEYRRAIEIEPDNVPARFNLATTLMRRNDLDQAMKLYRQLLEGRGDFAPAHHNLGLCLEQRNRLEEAIQAYERAIDADPGLASARNSLGLALEKQGNWQTALSEYRRALSYRPDYALAHFNLGDLLLSRGDAAAAEDHYQQGLSRYPDNVQARANRALALRILGRASEAAEELEKVRDARPDLARQLEQQLESLR
ncbi:MAG: tetratricopeptide repeat protein [bacterium]|nr:tetratricopeptide repeat protein [bacterium]